MLLDHAVIKIVLFVNFFSILCFNFRWMVHLKSLHNLGACMFLPIHFLPLQTLKYGLFENILCIILIKKYM